MHEAIVVGPLFAPAVTLLCTPFQPPHKKVRR
jgi:hypothetical protein